VVGAIAPVVAVPSAGSDWERVLRITAAAVNRADQEDAVIAESRAQVAAADVLLVGSFVGSQTDALVARPTFTALPPVHRRPGPPTQPLGHPRGIPS
jgi:hypothetical protein